MNLKNGKIGLVIAGVVIVAGLVGVKVWRNQDAPPPASPTLTTPVASTAPPSSVVVAATADPFAVLNCQAVEYNDSLALAVTFTQPVNAKTSLDQFLRVIESESPNKKSAEEGDESSAQKADAPPIVQAGEVSAKGTTVKGNWVVGDNPRLVYFPFVQPSRSYWVNVSAGLPSTGEKSNKLPAAAHCKIQTDAMSPSFYFSSKGVVLPAGQNGGLPVTTVNVPEVDVQFLRVKPELVPAFFSSMHGGDSSDDEPDEDTERYIDRSVLKGLVSSWKLDELRGVSASVYQGRFVTDDKPNRRHVTFLPVEDIKELQEPGIYIAVMSQPGRFDTEYQTSYFYVSDIGLHARRYNDSIEAYTVSLKTGQAISGTVVELIDEAGKSLAKASADSQGHVRFEGNFSKAKVLRATRGKEMTVLALGEPALDLSEFDIGGHASRANSLFVYAGRNLYRPGETFHVSALPRNLDGRVIASAPLTATIKRPDGRVVSTALWQATKDMPGYVEHEIELPADAQTGTWMLELRVDPAARVPDAAWKFQVEEFLPERMKVTLNTDQALLDPDEALTVNVQGDYLYGAPAAGNRLLASASVKRDIYALPQQWPGFIFGDEQDGSQAEVQELEPITLSDSGAGQLAANFDTTKTHSPMKIRLSASLLESGGRPVVRSIERPIWPAKALIAVRPQFSSNVVSDGSPAGFEVVRVNAEGQFVPLQQAQMRVYKEERRYYWRYDDSRGWNSGYTDTEELVDSRTIELKERASLTVNVKWGRYRLEVSDPETGLTLRYRFYAGWGAQDAEAMGNRPDRVKMQLEAVPAKPGDSVKLTMTPPHDGQALVTVEGDRMLWSTWVSVKATGTQIEIPIDKSWKRHDLYVSAVVFRPGSEGDRVTPARAVGLSYLPIDSAQRKLDVTLTAPTKVEPETQTTVRVKVAGAQGKQAIVTLSGVDVGILNINQYATPDPLDFFFGKHRYVPELLDMYGKLIEKMSGTKGKLKWGGDAALRRDSKSLPKKVKLVDLFSGPVKLNEQGEADIPLTLPDFNGTLRLMAVAFTADNFGSTDAEMVLAAPVVAELNTPRFISPGDQAAIALDVTNLSGAPQKLTIKLEALDPLSITDNVRTVSLKDKQRVTLRFVATTTGAYGLGLMRLRVDGQGGPKPLHIVRESVLQVQPAYAAERQVHRVRLNVGERQTPSAAWVASYYPDSTTVSLMVSNRPPLNVKRLVEGLLTYPYGCTEQTISSALPWVLIDDGLAKQYGLKAYTQAERASKVAVALGRLSGMRNAAGSYSLWGDNAASRDVWLTAYAVSFMQDARDQGFSIPDAQLERSRQWLLTQLQQGAGDFNVYSSGLKKRLAAGKIDSSDIGVVRDSHRHFAGLAAAALVLARDKKAPLSTLRQLYDRYEERARSPLPLMQFAIAFKLMGDEGRMKSAVTQALSRGYGFDLVNNRYGDEVWLGDYGSATRDYAWSYVLMHQYDLALDQRENFITPLVAQLSNRSYFSTQEQMALLLAARAMGGDANTAWRADLNVKGQQTVLNGGKNDQAAALSAADLAETEVVNTGTQPLFLEYDIQGSPMVAPAPNNDVITLKRSWYHMDGTPWDGGMLQTGDKLIVRIQADSKSLIPDALLVDRVPAGLEIENMNLSQGNAEEMSDWKIGGRNVAEAMNDSNIKHREFRDDRYVAAVELGRGRVDVFYMLRVVTPGRYTVPSTLAEDMYRPELRGVGERWAPVDIRDRSVGRR